MAVSPHDHQAPAWTLIGEQTAVPTPGRSTSIPSAAAVRRSPVT